MKLRKYQHRGCDLQGGGGSPWVAQINSEFTFGGRFTDEPQLEKPESRLDPGLSPLREGDDAMPASRYSPIRNTPLLCLSAALTLLLLATPQAGAAAGGGGGGGAARAGGGASEQRALKVFQRAEKLRVQGIEETRLALQESDSEEREEHMENAERKFKRALRDYKKAIRAKRDFHHAYNGMGFCQRMLGDFEAALESYDEALAIEPGFPPAVEYRGEAYLRLGRLEDAKAAYMELFRGERTLADLLMRKMQAWLNTQERTGAEKSEALVEFGQWIEKRSEIANQTAALVPGESGSHW